MSAAGSTVGGGGGVLPPSPPPPPAPGGAPISNEMRRRRGVSVVSTVVSGNSSTPGTKTRNEMPRKEGMRTSTDVASLRAGLFGALKDLRTQNQDLQAGISDLSKGRTLPSPPRSKPSTRPATWLETTQKLAVAEAERDKYKSQVGLLEKKLEDQQSMMGALRARGSSKETEIRDQIQELLKQRASELMNQVSQLEEENKELIMASGDQVALVASLNKDLGKERERCAALTLERNDARSAAKAASPARAAGGASPEKLMAALEQALDQRDYAIREKDASVAAREAMMVGFEDASAMMVEYTNELEATLGVAKKRCHDFQVAHLELKGRSDAFEGRLRVMEARGREQDALVGDLLEDLEKQRQLGGGTDEEKAKSIAFLRAKERERKKLAAAAVNFRKLSETNDWIAGGDSEENTEQGHALSALLELPEGWTEATSPEGLTYYINHVDQTTTWVHPGTGADDAGADGYRPATNDEDGVLGMTIGVLEEEGAAAAAAAGAAAAGGHSSGGGDDAVQLTASPKKVRKRSILAKLTRKSSASKTSKAANA